MRNLLIVVSVLLAVMAGACGDKDSLLSQFGKPQAQPAPAPAQPASETSPVNPQSVPATPTQQELEAQIAALNKQIEELKEKGDSELTRAQEELERLKSMLPSFKVALTLNDFVTDLLAAPMAASSYLDRTCECGSPGVVTGLKIAKQKDTFTDVMFVSQLAVECSEFIDGMNLSKTKTVCEDSNSLYTSVALANSEVAVGLNIMYSASINRFTDFVLLKGKADTINGSLILSAADNTATSQYNIKCPIGQVLNGLKVKKGSLSGSGGAYHVNFLAGIFGHSCSTVKFEKQTY